MKRLTHGIHNHLRTTTFQPLTCQPSTLTRRSEHDPVPIHGRDAGQRVDRYAERFEGFTSALEDLLDQRADAYDLRAGGLCQARQPQDRLPAGQEVVDDQG